MAAKRIVTHEEAATGNVVPLPARQPPRGANAVRETDDDDDAGLLGRIAVGDRLAFTLLMQRHLSAVLATARRIVRDEAEAEDIAQESFLRLWHTARTLEAGEYGMRPWLRRVASNLAIDCLRKAKRLDVTDELPEQIEEPGQLKALDASEVSSRVEEALAGLPPRQRVAVSLFHFDDMSQRDVAAMMELTEDALESLLARGRRRLRDILKDDWQELLAQSNGHA